MEEEGDKVSGVANGSNMTLTTWQTALDTSRMLPAVAPTQSDGTLRFTDVINGLQRAYSKQQMADISTSFCFISLLHLANERGLVIENQEGWQELSIRRDLSAEIVAGGD